MAQLRPLRSRKKNGLTKPKKNLSQAAARDFYQMKNYFFLIYVKQQPPNLEPRTQTPNPNPPGRRARFLRNDKRRLAHIRGAGRARGLQVSGLGFRVDRRHARAEDSSRGSPTQRLAGTSLSAVSVYLGSPVWCARALFRSRVDGFVPHTQDVNLTIVGQPE